MSPIIGAVIAICLFSWPGSEAGQWGRSSSRTRFQVQQWSGFLEKELDWGQHLPPPPVVPVSVRCRYGGELLQLFFWLSPSGVSRLKNMAVCAPKSGLTPEETGTTEMMEKKAAPHSQYLLPLYCLEHHWGKQGSERDLPEAASACNFSQDPRAS